MEIVHENSIHEEGSVAVVIKKVSSAFAEILSRWTSMSTVSSAGC